MSDFPEFITRLPEIDFPFDGVSGTLLQGEDQQAAFARFEDETVVPEHSHASQWELVVAGELCLTVDGVENTYREGDSFFIPAGAVHGAVVGAGYRAVIFFDQSDRYKAK